MQLNGDANTDESSCSKFASAGLFCLNRDVYIIATMKHYTNKKLRQYTEFSGWNHLASNHRDKSYFRYGDAMCF